MSLVSVVIPAHNAEEYLYDTLRSVLRQTHPEVEILVVDDGSTDGTATVVRQFGGAVRYLRQQNAGPSVARNAGLAAAQGEYVAFLDADDQFQPNRVAVMVDAHRGGSATAAFVTTDAWVTDNKQQQRRFRVSRPVPGERDLSTFLDETWCYIGILARRDALLRVGGFRAELRRGEDYDLWLRLLVAGGTYVYVPEPLYIYRARPYSLSSNLEKRLRAALRVEQDALTDLPLTPGERRRLRYLLWEDRCSLHQIQRNRARLARDWPAFARHATGGLVCHAARAVLRPGVTLRRLVGRQTRAV